MTEPEPRKPKTRKQWATIIRNDLGRAVENIVRAGHHLAQAKADLEHGEWLPFLEEDLHMNERTAVPRDHAARHAYRLRGHRGK